VIEPETAIVLCNLGGPDSLDAVEPFLYNLFSDRDIIRGFFGLPLPRFVARRIARKRAPAVRENYRLIGGRSPQLELTRRQAEALARALDRRVEIAMRYWHPRASATVAKLRGLGVSRVLALPLYPHYSNATTGSSLHDLEAALAQSGITLAGAVDRYADDPGYVDALCETIRDGLAEFPPERRAAVPILFSAHSLPLTFVKRGDPYPAEIQKTISAVMARVGGRERFHLAYQSKVGRIRWLEPSVEAKLAELAAAGQRELVVVPISFVSDHIETLQEIDLLYRGVAQRLGFERFVRCRALNDSPTFIAALARLCGAALARFEKGASAA
jgi:ferrochelatase